MERTGLDEAQLLIEMSHTHAGANANSQLRDKPGVELIEPYLDAAHRADRRTRSSRRRATQSRPLVTYGYGRCALATNRDFWDAGRRAIRLRLQPRRSRRRHAARRAGHGRRRAMRARRSSTTPATRRRSPGRTGCSRPTTSAPRARCWSARSARPALFFHGASGELAPARRLRRRHGRRRPQRPPARPRGGGRDRGLPPPGTRFVYTGIVASGANLGTWEYQPCDPANCAESGRLDATLTHVDLRRKDELGVVESLSDASPTQCRSARRRFAARSSSRAR